MADTPQMHRHECPCCGYPHEHRGAPHTAEEISGTIAAAPPQGEPATPEVPLATTYYGDDDTDFTVELLSKPNATGVVRCIPDNGMTITRHRDHLAPLNDAARKLLEKK